MAGLLRQLLDGLATAAMEPMPENPLVPGAGSGSLKALFATSYGLPRR